MTDAFLLYVSCVGGCPTVYNFSLTVALSIYYFSDCHYSQVQASRADWNHIRAAMEGSLGTVGRRPEWQHGIR
jgi:hypothetical protein